MAKIRNGFVSNSSSSSFIIGVGKVIDETKILEYLEKNKGLKGDVEIDTVCDLREASNWGPHVTSNNDVLVDSFDYSEVTLNLDNIGEEEKVVSIYHSVGDDSDFWNGDEYNYDIGLDFFNANIQELVTDPEKYGIDPKTFEFTYGAGRNG